jgi:hypothetical protein
VEDDKTTECPFMNSEQYVDALLANPAFVLDVFGESHQVRVVDIKASA